MDYTVVSGEIKGGVLYWVSGNQSVTYNSTVYNNGQCFRGISGIYNYTYSGTGALQLCEILEIRSGAIEFLTFGSEQRNYNETTILHGFGVEYEISDSEKIFNEKTKIQGFAFELIDYPFYSFEITVTQS